MAEHLHSRRSSIIAKKLWNFLRIAFLMTRKGLISKKKILMYINLFFKRGRLIRKTLSNLLHHHHHHHHRRQMTRVSYGLQEYEFSCSNSPNPLFFHVSSSSKRHHHHHHPHLHLPCMNPPLVHDEIDEPQDVVNDDHSNNAIVLVPKTPEHTFNLRLDNGYDLAPGDNFSPLRSPFSTIKISDYSSEDENESGGNVHVDHEAEEFIKQFYEQLRAQSRMQLLQY